MIVMLNINGCVQLLAMQFSFANMKTIPATIRNIGWETPEESEKRCNRNGNGILVIEPTLDCSLAEFLSDLVADWQMVEAFGQERINPNPGRRETFYMIRFTFVPRPASLTDYYLSIQDACQAGLEEMCQSAIWQVRVFSNPFYKNRTEVAGLRHLSINLGKRTPLFHPDGKPIVTRLKDESGQPIGDPLPIRPRFQLRIVGETIQLVPAE